jgi:hypothetical protein
MSGCPQCGSTETRWTGYLGHLTWASCRDCGAEYATLTADRTGLDENGDAPAPDELEYLATCPGWEASEQDESTRDYTEA